MKFYHQLSKAAVLYILGFAFLLTAAIPANAKSADWPWPYTNNGCQSKTNDFKRDCLGDEKFALRDMATKQISVAYIHKRTNLTKSELKKAVKLHRLSKDDQKAAYKTKNSIVFGGSTLDYEDAELMGLRGENGEVLLKTAFVNVFPMSPTHSLVQLANTEMMIAEHGTHKLTDTNYTAKDMFHIRAMDEETDLHYDHIFFVTAKGGYSASAVPLLPDMTIGKTFEFVEVKTWQQGLAVERGNGFMISVNAKPLTNGKWSDLLFDEWHKPIIDNPDVVSFPVIYGSFYKNDGTYDSTVSKVAPVGEIAEDLVAQRGGLTEKMLPLYWPYDENGALIPRADNIAGMMPVKRSRRGQYHDAWLVVYKDGASYDYAIANFDNTSAARNVASKLDSFEVLDDVYFRNAWGAIKFSYALKSKSRSGIAQPWYGYLADESPRENVFAVIKGDNVKTAYQGATAKSAIDARILEKTTSEDNAAREQAEREAQTARYEAESKARDERIEKAQFQAKFGWRNPTTPSSQCAASYAALQEEYIQNTANPYFQTKKTWIEKYEANGAIPCDTPPRSSSGGSTYTLSDGLRDMGNAAACTRQESKCVSDGQYERCSMVTVNVC